VNIRNIQRAEQRLAVLILVCARKVIVSSVVFGRQKAVKIAMQLVRDIDNIRLEDQLLAVLTLVCGGKVIVNSLVFGRQKAV
jgi:hypothetical protein